MRRGEPDLVLLDLNLPDGDGRDVCRASCARARDVPIIMLTARGTETDRVVGLEIGADDYVVKPFASAEVVARIRAVLRRTRAGAARAGREPPTSGGLRVDRAARRVIAGRRAEVALSRKEYDLLLDLAEHAGAVVTREDLMSRVWDENWFGSTKTLDVHIGWLRRKLGDDAADPRWIETVRGVGFRFAAPEGTGRRNPPPPPAARAGLRAGAGDRGTARAARAEPARPRRRRGRAAGALAGRGRRGARLAADRAAADAGAVGPGPPRRGGGARPRDHRRIRRARPGGLGLAARLAADLGVDPVAQAQPSGTSATIASRRT